MKGQFTKKKIEIEPRKTDITIEYFITRVDNFIYLEP